MIALRADDGADAAQPRVGIVSSDAGRAAATRIASGAGVAGRASIPSRTGRARGARAAGYAVSNSSWARVAGSVSEIIAHITNRANCPHISCRA